MTGFPDLSDHLLVLVYGWLLPFVSGLKGRETMEAMEGVVLTDRERRRFHLANSLFLVLGSSLVPATWAFHGRPFEALGFRDLLPLQDGGALFVSLTLLLVLLYAGDLFWSLRAAGRKTRLGGNPEIAIPFLPRKAADMPSYVLMCLSAAVSEETVYRGFMVAYFMPAYNGREGLPVLAVVVPAALFSLAHLYQGWQAVAKIMLLSMILACMFIAGGSIWPVMVAHFLIDVASGLAAMAIAGRMEGRRESSFEDGKPESD